MKLENFGPFKLLEIQWQNPFRNLIYKYRFNKAIKKRSKDRFLFYSLDKNEEIKFPENYWFKWSQLVEQEIFMYIRLGKQVELKEFYDLCQRRKFYPEQIKYLREIIKYVGLGKNL